MIMYEVIQSDGRISPSRSGDQFGAFELSALIQLFCFPPFIISRAALVLYKPFRENQIKTKMAKNNNKLTSD